MSTSRLGSAVSEVAFPRGVVLPAPSASRVAGLLALDLESWPPEREVAHSSAPGVRAATRCPWRSAHSSALLGLVIFSLLIAAVIHAALRSGSLAAPASVSPGRFEARSEESVMRKNPKSFAVAAAAALSVAAGAAAQDAVQWRVEDGGNGHWYRLDPVLRSWTVAQSYAASVGGHLATITTPAENTFLKSSVYFLGIFSDTWLGAVKSTPTSPWTWVTGESWGIPTGQSTSFDGVGFDAQSPLFLEQAIRNGTVLEWADESNSANIGNNSVIEWSADCNDDGIVDFGQIRAGELEDTNANNIPDCCENGNPCACDADVTGNGNVDAADLAAVLSAWGGASTGKANADVNSDGSVDAADLAAVLSSWGPCP